MEKTFTLQEFIEWVYTNSKYNITNIGSKDGKEFWLKYTEEVLPQADVIKSVCYNCGRKLDAMDLSVGQCYECSKDIKQTVL